MKQRKSSPLKDEPGIDDFVLTAKSKKEDTLNIDLDSPDVKKGVGSLFTIIGQAFQIVMEADNE